jgi:hypothetical protein
MGRALLYLVPIFVVTYALWGLFFGRRYDLWGLPVTCWYGMGGVVAALVLIINTLDRCDHDNDQR